MVKDLQIGLQRLSDLARSLELDDSTITGPAAAQAGQAKLKQHQDVGKVILRELARRKASQLPPLPGATENWDRVAPILKGLEKMGQRELHRLEKMAHLTQTEVITRLEELPSIWYACCRTALARTILTSSDFECSIGKIRRQLAMSIHAASLDFARNLNNVLLGRLKSAIDSLYPFASTADKMLQAIEHSFDSDCNVDTTSLVQQFASQLDECLHLPEVPTDHDSKNIEFVGHLGTLVSALGGEVVASSLKALPEDQIALEANYDPEVEGGRLRETVLRSVRGTLAQEWRIRRHAIQEAVDAHITYRYLKLQHRVDRWLDRASAYVSVRCGMMSDTQGEFEAIRFEVLDICDFMHDGESTSGMEFSS